MLEPTQPAIKYKALVGVVLESRMLLRNAEVPAVLSYGHPEDLIMLMFLSKAFPVHDWEVLKYTKNIKRAS
jgi:hypothetical protein